ERVEQPQQQSGDDAEGQPEQRNQNDEADDERQDQRDKTFEPLVVRQDGPACLQASPERVFGHGVSRVGGSSAPLYGAESVVAEAIRLTKYSRPRRSSEAVSPKITRSAASACGATP